MQEAGVGEEEFRGQESEACQKGGKIGHVSLLLTYCF